MCVGIPIWNWVVFWDTPLNGGYFYHIHGCICVYERLCDIFMGVCDIFMLGKCVNDEKKKFGLIIL